MVYSFTFFHNSNCSIFIWLTPTKILPYTDELITFLPELTRTPNLIPQLMNHLDKIIPLLPKFVNIFPDMVPYMKEQFPDASKNLPYFLNILDTYF